MKSANIIIALALSFAATASFAYEGPIAVKCSLTNKYMGTMSVPTDLKKWKTVKETKDEKEHLETRGTLVFNGMRILGLMKGYVGNQMLEIEITDADGFAYSMDATLKDENTIAFPMWLQYYSDEKGSLSNACQIRETKGAQTPADQPFSFKAD